MNKASPKLIGGFTVIAVLLAVAAVVIFGSGRLFKQHEYIIAFFEGSLTGLRVGAPVTLQGVQIGTVSNIWVQVEEDQVSFKTPALLEIDLSRIRGITVDEDEATDEHYFQEMVDNGFRAQLVQTSFVTGQQSVQLDFHPDTEVKLVETDLPYRQIPTVPSAFEALGGNIRTALEKASKVLDSVDKLLTDENRSRIGQTLANAESLTKNIEAGTQDLNDIVAAFKEDVPAFQKLIANANETLDSYKALADNANGVVDENREGIKTAIDGLDQLERKVGALADSANKLIEENRKGINDFTSTGLYELTNLAVDAQAAVEQFRRVMEELERDPARFLLGEPGSVEAE